jgi:hypothetical protein
MLKYKDKTVFQNFLMQIDPRCTIDISNVGAAFFTYNGADYPFPCNDDITFATEQLGTLTITPPSSFPAGYSFYKTVGIKMNDYSMVGRNTVSGRIGMRGYAYLDIVLPIFELFTPFNSESIQLLQSKIAVNGPQYGGVLT